MLPVRVKGHDDVGALLQRIVDAGLERSTLAEINRVADDRRRKRGCKLPGVVGRSIVDNDDVIASLSQSCDD